MASKRWTPSKGERVRVYLHGRAPFKATVEGVIPRPDARTMDVFVIEDGFYSTHPECPFHARQLRPIRKRARRRVWIRKEILHEISLLVDNKLGVTCVDRADSPEWIEFREVRKAKERP